MAETLEQKANGGIDAVKNLGLNYIQVENLYKDYKPEDETIPAQYAPYISPDQSKESIQVTAEGIKKMTPALVHENMGLKMKEYGQNLVGLVSSNYSTLANSLQGHELIEMALAASGKKQMQEEVSRAIKKGDMITVRKAYLNIESRKNLKSWQHFVMNADDNILKMSAAAYFEGDVNNFLEAYTIKKKDDKGEEVMGLDSKKLSGYILQIEANAKDDKEKQALYLRIGKSMGQYFQMQIMQAQEAQKKAEAEAKKAKKK